MYESVKSKMRRQSSEEKGGGLVRVGIFRNLADLVCSGVVAVGRCVKMGQM